MEFATSIKGETISIHPINLIIYQKFITVWIGCLDLEFWSNKKIGDFPREGFLAFSPLLPPPSKLNKRLPIQILEWTSGIPTNRSRWDLSDITYSYEILQMEGLKRKEKIVDFSTEGLTPIPPHSNSRKEQEIINASRKKIWHWPDSFCRELLMFGGPFRPKNWKNKSVLIWLLNKIQCFKRDSCNSWWWY